MTSLPQKKLSPAIHPAVWALAFTLGMAAIGYLEVYAGIGRIGAIVLMVPICLLLIPMMRSAQARAAAKGCSSPALENYNKHVLSCTLVYMVTLTIGITLHQKSGLSGGIMWFAGILPSLPVLGLIWTMLRYMREEEDEYLRARAANAGLIGTGLLLAIATVWGFLEMFGLLPHIPSWAAVPVWAIGMGMGQLAQGR